MKMNYPVLILGVSLLQLSGCAIKANKVSNEYMKVQDPQKEYYPSNGKALLIVERTEDANLALYAMAVWDITDRRKPKLIGYLAATMKAAYELDPGEHTLLLQLAATNNIMKMKVEKDKTYFTKVGTNGFYTALFFPVKQGNKNTITRNNISLATEYLKAWGEDSTRVEESVQTRIDKGSAKWLEMSDEEKILRSIVPEDGR